MSNIRNSILMMTFFISGNAFSENYVVPPTSITNSHVPVISDAAMEECVKLYNEAEWLSKKIRTINVDNYSQSSVDNYNNKIDQHSQMLDRFNRDCAGKQSRSAYEAAKRLNATQ